MRYNRADIGSAIKAAQKLNKMSYVFATANGFTIAKSPPPANQRFVRVSKEGNIFYHEPTFLVDIIGGI